MQGTALQNSPAGRKVIRSWSYPPEWPGICDFSSFYSDFDTLEQANEF